MEFLTPGYKNSMGSVDLKYLPSQEPNLIQWNRKNTGITVTGSGISQWDDVSGNGNHLKQGTDANRPSKEANGSVLTDGLAHYMQTDAYTLNQAIYIYILGKQVTWTGLARIFDGKTATTGLLRQKSGGISPELEVYAGNLVFTNSDLALDTDGVITVGLNGASSLLGIDKNTELTGDAGANNMGGLTIGASGSGANFANFQYQEIIVFDAAQDAATKLRLKNYLARVGGLSI